MGMVRAWPFELRCSTPLCGNPIEGSCSLMHPKVTLWPLVILL